MRRRVLDTVCTGAEKSHKRARSGKASAVFGMHISQRGVKYCQHYTRTARILKRHLQRGQKYQNRRLPRADIYYSRSRRDRCHAYHARPREQTAFESGHEYTVESSSGKKAALVICSFALVFILSGAVDFALAERKAETQPYNTHDISMSDSERDRICAILSSYGISDDNIALLPDSELQKYSNAVSADELDDTMKDLIANWNARPEFSFKSKDIEYNFERHEYCIIIDSGEPHNYIRTLYFLELQDSEQTRNDRKYVDGMIFNYTDATASNYLMPLNMGGEYNGDLFMILTEENGGLVETKPLNIQPDSDASINRINRVEFQLKDGLKIIYAAYLGEPSDDSSKILTANYTVQYVHRKLPIQSPASRALIHQTGISTPAYCRRNDIHPCDVSYESIFKEPFVDSEDEASDFTEDIIQ